MLDLFFLSDAPPYPLLWAQHNRWLVALSVGMAVLAWLLQCPMGWRRAAGLGWLFATAWLAGTFW